MAAARRSQPAWASLAMDDRAARSWPPREAGVAAVEDLALARLLTREHGKTHLEAIFDTATMAGMASAFAPLVAEALAPRDLGGGVDRASSGCPTAWSRDPALQLARLGHGQQGAPRAAGRRHRRGQGAAHVPGTVLLVAAAMAAALPPGVLNVVNGPGRPSVLRSSATPASTWSPSPVASATGQAVMAAAAATTRPVVLELGGNDAAILAPDMAGDAALAARIVEAAFVTSGQVCMAIKRLYVHRDRFDETVDALGAGWRPRWSATAWPTG